MSCHPGHRHLQVILPFHRQSYIALQILLPLSWLEALPERPLQYWKVLRHGNQEMKCVQDPLHFGSYL